jgi:hypothetical protein
MFRMIFYSLVGCLSLNLTADEGKRLIELNTYWEEVSGVWSRPAFTSLILS